jgi:hypothetical protein
MRDTGKIVNIRSDADLIVGAQVQHAGRYHLKNSQQRLDDRPVVVEPHAGLEVNNVVSPISRGLRTPVALEPNTPELEHSEIRNKNATDPIIAIVSATGACKVL